MNRQGRPFTSSHTLMTNMTRILVFLAATGLPIVSAQNASLQFLAFPKHISPEPVEVRISENKTMEVQTPGNELSPAYEVPKLEFIIVGKTTLNEKQEPVFHEYGRAKSLGVSKQIVLLMRKGRENRDGFVVVPVNGDLADFGGGAYLFINASNLNVGGVIGDSKFALKPGQRQVVRPKPNFEEGICQVTLAYQREDKWKTFKDTRWSSNEAYRSLVFFYQNPESGRLAVAPVVDMLPYQSSNPE